MKKQFNHLKLFLTVLLIITAFSSPAQNSFTHISARENRSGNGNGTMLENPDINNNPKAILFVTQKDPGLNPHPIYVYYFKGKWNIMNLDQAAMPMGAAFIVEYFLNPDADHFKYLIKKEDMPRKDGSVLIDHPALNDRPDANARVIHSWVPEAKEYGNGEEIILQYDQGAGKWHLSNVSNKVNKSLPVNSAYNIAITSGINSGSPKAVQVNEVVIKPALGNVPKTLTIDGMAGGDLGGTYPNPTVEKLLGRPLSITAPGTGQLLKWNGTEWAPAKDEVGSSNTTAAGWSVNGNNLNNTNTGNVGIGNNNPAYQLDVNGRMRIRSSGSKAGSAGVWLNNDANQEVAFIGMEDDNHVGFFGVVGGWRFGMNTNTGALKINGSEGQSGQVLVSNGAAAPGYTTIGNVIRAEIKNGSGSFEALVTGTEYHLPQLTHTITLTAKSRIIITAKVTFYSGFCVLCENGFSNLVIKVNNSMVTTQRISTSPDIYTDASICNYIIELDPGTHNLDFYDYYDRGTKHITYPKYSSIIIIPVD